MAQRVRRERRQRGFFGGLFLVLFWAFNAFMAWWLFSYWGQLAGTNTSSRAEEVGTAIGGTIGSGMLLTIWVMGDFILGLFVLFTRGQKVIIEDEPDEPGAARTLEAAPRSLDTTPLRPLMIRDRSTEEVQTGRSPEAVTRREPEPVRRKPAAPNRHAHSPLPPQLKTARGWFVEVVGEASYQEELEQALRIAKPYESHQLVIVSLQPEPHNPHDENAVRVDHRGDTLGYLPRAAAKQYRAALGEQAGTVSGSIVGGGIDQEDGEPLMFGIWLNAAWPPAFKA